jgi:hypothetical protein
MQGETPTDAPATRTSPCSPHAPEASERPGQLSGLISRSDAPAGTVAKAV